MRPRISALVTSLLALLAVVPTAGVQAGVARLAPPPADVRITQDDRAGSYVRYDGASDDVTRFCSTARRGQYEPAVAVDPRNPDVIVTATEDGCVHERALHTGPSWVSLHRSTDGGRTWQSGLLPGYPGDTSPAGMAAPFRYDPNCPQYLGDPSATFDAEGRLYVTVLCGDEEFQSLLKLWMAVYEDDGARYVRTIKIAEPSPCSDDREIAAADTTDGPYAGTVYVVYNRSAPGFGPCPASPAGIGTKVLVSRSIDHGQTFLPPVEIHLPNPSAIQDLHTSDITAGPDGAVYAIVRDYDDDTIYLSKSVDGGATFGTAVPVAYAPTFWSGQFSADYRVMCGDGPWRCQSGFTYPIMTNDMASVTVDATGVHMVWAASVDGGDGRGRIFVRNSPDGVNWDTPAAFLDSVPRGHQWEPDAASADGVISVVFYDSRYDPAYSPDLPPGNRRDGTSSGKSVDVVVARSEDGGTTWIEQRLTSTSFSPGMQVHSWARLPFIGDYLQVSAAAGRTYAVWTDNRDVVAGTDSREGARNNGFAVYAPCLWVPNSVNTEDNSDYTSPAWTDPCLSKGGLDQNIYGAALS